MLATLNNRLLMRSKAYIPAEQEAFLVSSVMAGRHNRRPPHGVPMAIISITDDLSPEGAKSNNRYDFPGVMPLTKPYR